jgi:hypothetical protein
VAQTARNRGFLGSRSQRPRTHSDRFDRGSLDYNTLLQLRHRNIIAILFHLLLRMSLSSFRIREAEHHRGIALKLSPLPLQTVTLSPSPKQAIYQAASLSCSLVPHLSEYIPFVFLTS